MSEVWKDIPGFDGKYRCSNLGSSMSFSRYKTGKILKPWLQKGKRKTGYLAINLSREHRFLVHYLVVITWIGPRINNMTVNHKDGNKLNNSCENLEWSTYSENNRHAYANKLKMPNIKTGTQSAVGLFSKTDLKLIKVLKSKNWTNTKIGRHFDVGCGTIGRIIKGITYKGEY